MGISAIVGTVIDAVTTAGAAIASTVGGAAAAIGIPTAISTAIGTGAEYAIGEGILGAGVAAASGGNALKGFEQGAITGGVTGGLGPALASTGIGLEAGDTLTGAAGGALGALATGGNVGAGALEGAGSGALAGALSGGLRSGGGSAAPSAPASVTAGGAPTDTSAASALTDTGGLPGQVSAAPTDSTLPGSVGAGAAAPSSSTSVTGIAPQSGPLTTLDSSMAATGFTPGPISNGGLGPISGPAAPSGPLTGIDSAMSASGFTPTNVGSTNVSQAPGLSSIFKSPQALLFGADLLAGNRAPAYSGQIGSTAASLGNQGQALRDSLLSGVLPPGLDAEITASSDAALATERSFYAAHGMEGSSAEAQDLAAVGERAAAQRATIATQLFNSGVQESQISAGLYEQLMNTQIAQDQEMSQAISGLVSSLASFSQPVTPTPGG